MEAPILAEMELTIPSFEAPIRAGLEFVIASGDRKQILLIRTGTINKDRDDPSIRCAPLPSRLPSGHPSRLTAGRASRASRGQSSSMKYYTAGVKRLSVGADWEREATKTAVRKSYKASVLPTTTTPAHATFYYRANIRAQSAHAGDPAFPVRRSGRLIKPAKAHPVGRLSPEDLPGCSRVKS